MNAVTNSRMFRDSGYLGSQEPSYRALALDLDMDGDQRPGALRRLRQRYGDDPAKTEDELRYVISLMRS